jgi:hypothetical protein
MIPRAPQSNQEILNPARQPPGYWLLYGDAIWDRGLINGKKAIENNIEVR